MTFQTDYYRVKQRQRQAPQYTLKAIIDSLKRRVPGLKFHSKPSTPLVKT